MTYWGWTSETWHRVLGRTQAEFLAAHPAWVDREVRQYLIAEGNGFDCSVEEGYSLRLPSAGLLEGLGLVWTGRGAEFADKAGTIVMLDSSAHTSGPGSLLAKREALWKLLDENELTLVWAVFGEKRSMGRGWTPDGQAVLRIEGAYILRDSGPEGSPRFSFNEYGGA